MPRHIRCRANIFELQLLEIRRFLTTASINNTTHTLVITGTSSADTITLNQSSSTGKVSISGVSGSFTPGSGSNQFNKISIDGAGGNDTIQINGNVAYTGATIGGGGGNDTMTGGSGPDQLSGGSGFDTANYSLRTTGINVSIDGVNNDGQTNEHDNVTTDTEEVIGGAGNDKFTGSGNDDFFAGGAGNDTAFGGNGNDDLTGSTGTDSLSGQNGDDFLQAKNNDVDTVSGGTNTDGSQDFDLAEVDGIDVGQLGPVSFGALGPVSLAPTTSFDPAALDTSFNGTGTNTGPDLGWQQVTAATVDSSGRTVLVGYAFRQNGQGYSSEDMVAARYNADGTFDTDFGNAGEAVVDFTTGFGYGYADDDIAYGVTTDSNDNIYIVGSSTALSQFKFDSDFALVKLDSTGARDSLFGDNGQVRVDAITGAGYSNDDDQAHDVALDQNGNIDVVGTQFNSNGSDIVLMRFTSSGALDTTFGNNGQDSLDAGFNDDGVAIGFQEFGAGYGGEKIVIGGTSDQDFLVARFNENGGLDSTFGENEGYERDHVLEGQFGVLNDIAIDSNNNIYAVGETAPPIIGRNSTNAFPAPGASGVIAAFNSDATSFTNKVVTLPDIDLSFSSVVFDAQNNNLIVGGATSEDFVLGEFNASTLDADPNFNGGDLVQTDFTPDSSGTSWQDVALEVSQTSDGKIILAGYSDTTRDGTIQTSVARYGLTTGPHDDTDGIEQFVSYDNVQKNPPDEPLASHLQNLSQGALLYVLAQPDDNGVARLNLTNANDVVTIAPGVDANGDPQIYVTVNNIAIPYDPSTTTLLSFNLGGGSDFLFTAPGVTVPILVDAGDGNDTVTTGDGTDAVIGGAGNDVIHGGAGADVLLGGLGRDSLYGDNDRDLLIGGADKDYVDGGSGEDIVIGGTTAWDNNGTALNGIITEWTSLTPNADRINHIRNGGGINGSFTLKVGSGATVFDDAAKDSLVGGSERDWFFRRATGTADSILDNIAGEEVNNV